jgi:hypothetical protein
MLALPILVFRYPPMGDLAGHEAIVAILRHFGDPRYFPAGLYEKSFGQPNQLFHAVAWLLSLALPTDTACKIVVGATVLGTSVAAGRLAEHLRVTPWAAVLVAPLALGWMFRWGLIANMLGFAIWLAALPPLDRHAREPTPTGAIATSSLSVLLYLAHESSMLVYAVAAVVFAVRTPRRPRPLLLVALPVITAGLLAVAHASRADSLKAASVRTVGDMTTPFVQKLESLPATLFTSGWTSLPLLFASLVAMMALASERFHGSLDGKPSSERETRIGDARFGALAAILLGLYFAMPLTLSGSTLIHQRFLAPAFAIAVLAAAPAGGRTPRWAPALGAFPVAMLAATLGAFVEQDESYRALDRVLARMEDGSAVAQLDLTPRDPGPMAPVVGAAARALAVHGGRLLFSFTDAPALPIKMPVRYQWNEPVLRLAPTPFAFMPAFDLLRFRYVLVYERARAMDAVLETSFGPEARLVTKEGPWLLFESTLPLVPLTAGDASLPSPRPEVLADRVRRALAARR